MKGFGICSITFRPLSVAEIIDLVKKDGLDCVEWGGDVHVPVGDIEKAKKVNKLCKDACVTLNSYGSYFRAGVDEDFESVCKTAQALGTDIIRVWAGMEKEAEDYTEEQYLALIDAVKSMADTAKAYGQKVAFEYHYLTYCNKASSILKLISDVDKDNVFTYWQPAYWINAYWNKGLSEDQRIEYNLEEIKKLGDKIVNVHVYSWRGHDRFALSFDKEEWSKYFSVLPHVNAYMEFVKDNTLEQFSLDAKTLLSLGKK